MTSNKQVQKVNCQSNTKPKQQTGFFFCTSSFYLALNVEHTHHMNFLDLRSTHLVFVTYKQPTGKGTRLWGNNYTPHAAMRAGQLIWLQPTRRAGNLYESGVRQWPMIFLFVFILLNLLPSYLRWPDRIILC